MADTPVNIEWNPANWITVILMVAIGFTALGFLARAWQQKNGQGS
jgi:hypothetical protein